jgi:hypothetical protein
MPRHLEDGPRKLGVEHFLDVSAVDLVEGREYERPDLLLVHGASEITSFHRRFATIAIGA